MRQSFQFLFFFAPMPLQTPGPAYRLDAAGQSLMVAGAWPGGGAASFPSGGTWEPSFHGPSQSHGQLWTYVDQDWDARQKNRKLPHEGISEMGSVTHEQPAVSEVSINCAAWHRYRMQGRSYSAKATRDESYLIGQSILCNK